MTAHIGFGYYAGVPRYAPAYADPGAWHLQMDPGDIRPHPGRWLGRAPTPGDGWEWQCVERGQRGAEDFANRCLPWWRKARWCEGWTGPNEPGADTVQQAQLLSQFYIALVPLAKAAGVQLWSGSFSRGRPDENILEHYLPMLQACEGRVLVHEYGFADMRASADVGWHCLRYRRLLAICRRYGLHTRMIAAELGLDNNAGGGWQWYKVSPPSLAEQLRWWAGQAAADPEMEGGILFALSAYGFSSFIITEEVARLIPAINAALPQTTQPACATAYSQRDPRWCNDALGVGGGQTIGQAGCLISAMASALVDLGFCQYTPRSFNEWLKTHAGYADGNEFVWSAPAAMGAELVHLVECPLTPAPIAAIRDALAGGQAIVAQVDAVPGGKVDQHWVRILEVDADGRDASIMDPWQMPGCELSRLSQHYEAKGWDVARALFTVAIYRRK